MVTPLDVRAREAYLAAQDQATTELRERVRESTEALTALLERTFDVAAGDVTIDERHGGYVVAKVDDLRFALTIVNNVPALLAWWNCRCNSSHAGKRIVATLADLGAVVEQGTRTEATCRG